MVAGCHYWRPGAQHNGKIVFFSCVVIDRKSLSTYGQRSSFDRHFLSTGTWTPGGTGIGLSESGVAILFLLFSWITKKHVTHTEMTSRWRESKKPTLMRFAFKTTGWNHRSLTAVPSSGRQTILKCSSRQSGLTIVRYNKVRKTHGNHSVAGIHVHEWQACSFVNLTVL